MYGREQRVPLRHYLERGLSKAEIARELGVARRAVYHWIATGQLERELDEAPVRYAARPPIERKVDPFRGILAARLAEFPRLSAVRLFEEIRAAGYAGGYTQVKDRVREMRPRPAPDPVVRFETPPGHQGQVDFAEFRLPWGKRYALLVVLAHSRLLWLQFYTRQTMLVLMRGLEDAFAYFGGVPAELLFDQLKAVIIDDERAIGGRLLENAEFLRFAAHWDFRIRACRPYRAKTKGQGRAARQLRPPRLLLQAELPQRRRSQCQALSWLAQTANARLHRTTAEVPQLRFERDEPGLLRPLAVRPYRSLVVASSPPERSK
jgi:transposase